MPEELLNREDCFCRVAVLYHGEEVSPRITVEVWNLLTGEMHEIMPDDDKVMEVFNHPFVYTRN